MPSPRRPSALLAALLVLVTGFVALSATRAPEPPLPSRAEAMRAVLSDPEAARALTRGEPWTDVRISPVDRETARVTLFDGARIRGDVALTREGRVDRFVDFRQFDAPYGAPLSHAPWLIALGCLAFVLATAVLPLRRLRNLDVLALLALVVPLVLLDERFVAASTLAAIPLLGWLAARCAWVGLGPPRPPSPSRPLLDALTPSWSDGQRVRVLRLAVVATAASVAMITVSARTTVDVAHAVMEGATLLLDGVLPYGNLSGEAFHGDTYPLLSYLAYTPLAAVMPVRDGWDVANGGLIVAAASSLVVAWMLARGAGIAGVRRHPRAAEQHAAGLRAALAWLAYPPLIVSVSSGTSDLLLAALLVGALVLVRRPLASTALLLLAGWFKLVPFALAPIWLARLRGRRLVVACAMLAGSAVATAALLVALGGAGAPVRMLEAMAFQLERRSLHSPWTLLDVEWLQPLGQAAVLALVAGATVRVRRDPALFADPARLAAIAGAVLIGLQLAGNYWTYLYLAWTLPCLVLSPLLAAGERTASQAAVAPPARRAPAAAEPAPV